MFNRKKSIVPYPNSLPNTTNNNKIKPSNTLSDSTTGKLLTKDILEQMRSNQMISNYEFMHLSMLKEILLTLNKIEVNTAQTAVSTEFTGRYIQNKFKWF